MYEITCPHNTKINIVFNEFGWLNPSNSILKLECCKIDNIYLYDGYYKDLLRSKQFIYGIYMNNVLLTLSQNFLKLYTNTNTTQIPYNIEFDSYQESFDYFIKLINNLDFL